jgi:hypothetical protein
MDVKDIVKNFESNDVHQIMDGVWAVVDCTDLSILNALQPFIKQWRSRIRKIDLGGAFYRNSNHFDMAMSYIEDLCNGGCHCCIYRTESLFSPEVHERKQFVLISNTQVDVGKYETIFDVECSFCAKKFKVTEITGWHVPWYEWRAR